MTAAIETNLWDRAWFIERGFPTERVPLLDIFHALAVARDFQKATERQPFVQQLVAYMLSCLGGTAMGSLLLGQPIGWLANDVVVATYVLVFTLSWWSVTRGLFKALVNAPGLATIIGLMDDASWGNCVTMLGVQRALIPLHGQSPIKHSTAAALLLGTLAGCGGGFIRTTFNMNRREWFFSVPRHLSAPHFPVQLSAFMATLFYVMTNPHKLLPIPADAVVDVHVAKWIVIAICCAANTGLGLIQSPSTSVTPAPAAKAVKAVKAEKAAAPAPVPAATADSSDSGSETATGEEEEVTPSPSPASSKASKRKSKGGAASNGKGKKA